MFEIKTKYHPTGVDFEALMQPGLRPQPERLRAGIEDGYVWVNAAHTMTTEEAKALSECLALAIEYQPHDKSGTT